MGENTLEAKRAKQGEGWKRWDGRWERGGGGGGGGEQEMWQEQLASIVLKRCKSNLLPSPVTEQGLLMPSYPVLIVSTDTRTPGDWQDPRSNANASVTGIIP